MFLAQPGEFGDIRLINTNTLAYIGDAVYELYIREHAMQIRMENVDMMSSLTVKYVKAESQALGIKAILDPHYLLQDSSPHPSRRFQTPAVHWPRHYAVRIYGPRHR